MNDSVNLPTESVVSIIELVTVLEIRRGGGHKQTNTWINVRQSRMSIRVLHRPAWEKDHDSLDKEQNSLVKTTNGSDERHKEARVFLVKTPRPMGEAHQQIKLKRITNKALKTH